LAVFTKLSGELQQEYAPPGSDPWEASPFAWVKPRAPATKGKIGAAFITGWAASIGIRVTPPTTVGHDCVLDGVRVEAKTSLLWEGGGFLFQQIRDQDFEVAALLGLEPTSVRLWIVPKDELWERLPGQHTGASGQDTKWLRFQATNPPAWLEPFGGTLAAARASLEQTRRDLGR
jgi:hypothetical protein